MQFTMTVIHFGVKYLIH